MTLTREQIMSMSAGYELDAMVAGHVMQHSSMRLPEDIRHYHLPNYSTDIAEAWEVIDKIQSEWSWEMHMYNAALEVDVRIGKSYFTSKSVPHAICICALLTLIKKVQA